MIKIRCLGVFLLLCLFQAGVFSQDVEPLDSATVPESLRRPQRGEAPRYPSDTVIGELGKGTAPEDAWRFAQTVLAALVQGNKEAPVLAQSGAALVDGLLAGLESLGPEKYRLGGGRVEADGAVSFLIRFLGKEQSMSGELYLRREEAAEADEEDAAASSGGEPQPPALVISSGHWFLDDLVLEPARDLADLREEYRYDFTPYERFY
ncbi:hypothetical protein [Leadbettera azotonutricia]|uniref:Uncharacterized protein n=1 Tax=Leadbettera azotonutricia (strain ATCC BAA-888 / DSM 13862 / ZAS-9) TaxID=545695 RepID=F5YAE3_LEAAZ|nr:hypothetical protein [Leadbettera azotonutricia]AEF82116.1 hypothetical protein TREAZ_3128 [Leadbettera azotonutricia ZAS-9]